MSNLDKIEKQIEFGGKYTPEDIAYLLRIARAAEKLPSARDLLDAMEGKRMRDFMIVMQHYANEFGALSLALKGDL